MTRPRQTGFTLVELVLVIALLGVLSIFASSRLPDTGVYDAYEYAAELRSALRHAQKLALASGCRVQLSQDASGFRLQRDSDCLSSTADFSAAVADPLGGSSYQRSLPVGVSPSPASVALHFDSLGRASSALSLQIGSHSIRVVAATGLIE